MHTESNIQGAYTPKLKLDPVWTSLLALPSSTLHTALSLGDHASLDDQASRVVQGAVQRCPGNASEACLGVAVVFPPTMEVLADAPADAPRLRSRAQPATAALSDWPAALQSVFGTDVALAGHGLHQTTVVVPAHLLAPVLTWLAVQPAVHWLTPRWALRQHNFEASAIIQSGQGAGNKAMNDAGTRPIWAAGITGSNQVVGMGDSGMGT